MKYNHLNSISSFTFVLIISFYSCIATIKGNGNVVTEEREISSFESIKITGGFQVMLRQGDEEKLKVEADENLQEFIITEVRNNTLHVSYKEKIGKSTALRLYINFREMEKIDLSGAVELRCKGVLEADKLVIDMSGATNLDMSVKTQLLKMEVSGASTTILTGTSDKFVMEISGAGELDAGSLESREAVLEISGAGSAVVNASEKLDVEISGAGSVKYLGNPAITKSISGAGSVRQI